MSLLEEAQKLLLHQFQNSPILNDLIKNLVKPLDEILDQIQAILESHFLLTASDQSLDLIGDIVGQKRGLMDDAEYRQWLRIRIRLNKSSGTPENILHILNILFIKALINEYGCVAMITFLKEPKTQIKYLYNIIKTACPMTININFKKAFLQPIFAFDSKETFLGKFAEFYGDDHE